MKPPVEHPPVTITVRRREVVDDVGYQEFVRAVAQMLDARRRSGGR